MQPEQKNRRLLIIGAALLVGTALFVWYFTSGGGARVKAEIYVAPSDATVTIDGKPIKAGSASIKKGKHAFKATRQYFSSATKEVDTADLTSTKTIYLALYPNDPRGQTFLDTHPDEQTRYERIAGAEFSATQEKIIKDYPITAKLPYQTVDYKIDYDVTNDKHQVVFLVKFYMPNALTEGSDRYNQHLLELKNDALKYLKNNGVDPSKEKITFTPDVDN